MNSKDNLKITIPPVPNRIMDENYKHSIPIEQFSDLRLTEIANEWKANLLKKARDRRREQP